MKCSKENDENVNTGKIIKVEKEHNQILEYESGKIIKLSKYAFINDIKTNVYESATRTIKAGTELINSMIEAEIAYQNLKDRNNFLEIESEKRELIKKKILLEKMRIEEEINHIEQRKRNLQNQNKREDFEDDI